jgi:hypothetical protein
VNQQQAGLHRLQRVELLNAIDPLNAVIEALHQMRHIAGKG